MNFKLSKNIRIYKNFLIFGTVDAVCLMLTFFYIIPSVKKLPDMFKKIQVQTEENGRLKKKSDFLKGLDYDLLADNTQTVLEVLPDEKSIPSFISVIDALTAANNVSLTDFSISRPGSIATESAQSTITEKEIKKDILISQISLTASVNDIRSFFMHLKRIRKIIQFLSINIFFESQDFVTVEGDIATFYSPLPTKLDKIDSIEPFSNQEESMIKYLTSLESLRQIYDILPMQTTSGIKLNPFSPQ